MECHFRLNDFNCALCYTLFLCDETNSSNAAVCVNICGFQARSITSSRWSQGRSTLSGSRMILIASCTTPGTPSHGNQRHNVFSNVQSFTANTTYIYISIYIYTSIHIEVQMLHSWAHSLQTLLRLIVLISVVWSLLLSSGWTTPFFYKRVNKIEINLFDFIKWPTSYNM